MAESDDGVPRGRGRLLQAHLGLVVGWGPPPVSATAPTGLTGILPVFITNHLLSRLDRVERPLKIGSTAVTQPNINAETIKALRPPRPHIPEQEEIILRVENLFALADRFEARYTKAKAHVDRLTQSVLAKAFRGELVPTEAELARREGRPYLNDC